MHHQVLCCEQPHVLSLTWGEGNETPSEVTFGLNDAGEQVRLGITNRRLADADTMVNVASGWHTHLVILTNVLQAHTPVPFQTTFEHLEEEYRCRIMSPRTSCSAATPSRPTGSMSR